MTDTNELLDTALDAAFQAGRIVLSYFQTDSLAVETKSDLSPVTAADRAAEEFLCSFVRRRFPDHGVLGEEFGETRGTSSYRWILDPIDGTKSFVHGVPLFGTMIAVEDQRIRDSVVGVVHFPALQETVWASKGGGCYWNGRRAHVSGVRNVSDAVVLLTDPARVRGTPYEALLEELQATCKFVRSWGDCYGHALIATGRAEIMLDPHMHLWDVAALKPIVEEAGGRTFDLQGRSSMYTDNLIACNADLADWIKDRIGSRKDVVHAV